MTTALSTEQRLEEVDRQVVAVQQGFVEAIGRLQESSEVDESFEARWREIADRIKGLRYGLQSQDFDKEQVAAIAGILLDMRDSIDAVNAAPYFQDLEAFDSLLIHLERIRHVVRDALDEHVAGSRRDVGLLIRDIDEWLPSIARGAVAELAGVDRRTLTRWARRSSPPTRRMQMVGQLISILRHNWTEEGVIAWFHRPRRDLGGRTPLSVLSSENFDEDALLSAARAGRSQYAS